MKEIELDHDDELSFLLGNKSSLVDLPDPPGVAHRRGRNSFPRRFFDRYRVSGQKKSFRDGNVFLGLVPCSVSMFFLLLTVSLFLYIVSFLSLLSVSH